MDRQTDEQYVSSRMGQNINMMTDFTYAHMLDETMTPVDQLVKHWSTGLVVPGSSWSVLFLQYKAFAVL